MDFILTLQREVKVAVPPSVARRGASRGRRARGRAAGTGPSQRARDRGPGRRRPLNRDSGQYRGPRRVWGGRASVRTILYMATVTATRHNPAIRVHTRLCRRGKPRKVALVAAMRKLLLILNAVVRDQVPWQPDRMPMAGET